MKKGFTLIEILAVVVLLGVLGLIATVTIDNILSENRQKAYTIQIDNIEESARLWAAEHVFELPGDGESMVITLGELKKQGYAKGEFINPITNKPFSNNLQIKIISSNNNYVYDVIEE